MRKRATREIEETAQALGHTPSHMRVWRMDRGSGSRSLLLLLLLRLHTVLLDSLDSIHRSRSVLR